MAHTIYLGSFSKRINSTKRPAPAVYEEWDSYECNLKQVTSYDNPTLLLQEDFGTIIARHYNYAVIFGRWYWVTDIRSVRNNLIELDLSVDLLATYQWNIKNCKAFIEYGFNSFDAGDAATRIADTRRAVSKNPALYTVQADMTAGALSSTGCYIMEVVSELWGVACYAVDEQTLNGLITNVQDALYNDIDNIASGLDLTDVAKNVGILTELMARGYKDSLLNESAINAIKSIHWIPLSLSEVPGITGSNIYLGTYPTQTQGKRIPYNSLWTNSVSLSIPWPASDWRRSNAQISLYLPFFGTVPVPVDQCINNSSINVQLSLDILGGDLACRVTSGSQTIYTATTNAAAPYAFGISSRTASSVLSGGIQMAGGSLQMASGVVDAGASVVSAFIGGGGGGFTSAANTALAGAQNMASGYTQTIQPLITSAGSMGGIAALGLNTNAILTLLYFEPINDPDFEAIYGHPVFKVATPVNGFCKTRGCSIDLVNEGQYAAIINAVMDAGIFIED